MENATKALLIAAAILIAILIISLGIVVYRMAAETVGSVNLSEAEMTAFNGKFETSAGPSVSGSSVNALLSTVFTHNTAEKAAGTTNYVSVSAYQKGGTAPLIGTNAEILDEDSDTIPKVPTGSYYKVALTYANGLVTTVTITAK